MSQNIITTIVNDTLKLSDEEIGTIMLKLNIRPRKRLGFIKPI
jgi:IS30 family transposase